MLSLLLWRKRSNLSLPGGDGDAVQNQVARRGAQVEGEKSGATAGTVAYAPPLMRDQGSQTDQGTPRKPPQKGRARASLGLSGAEQQARVQSTRRG